MNVKKRFIYDNYNLFEQYDNTLEFLKEERPNDDISDNDVWDQIYFDDSVNWENELSELKSFFGNSPVIIAGSVERWTGVQTGYNDFPNFESALSWCFKDCDYIRLWDENGRFLMQGSHHDGTNCYQLKIINSKAVDYLNYSEKDYFEKLRTVFNSNFLSRLPHYMHTVYGCPRKERDPA